MLDAVADAYSRMDFAYFLNLVLLCGISFVQNMAFTASSRSRNSGDPGFHRKIAWLSNGIYFGCHMFIIKNVMTALMENDWLLILPVALCYTLTTAEGSVFAMKLMLKTEDGKKRVGAR